MLEWPVVPVVTPESEIDLVGSSVDDDHLVEVPYRDQILPITGLVYVIDVGPIVRIITTRSHGGDHESTLPDDFVRGEVVDEDSIAVPIARFVVGPRFGDEQLVTVDQIGIVSIGEVESFGPNLDPGPWIELGDEGSIGVGRNDQQVSVRLTDRRRRTRLPRLYAAMNPGDVSPTRHRAQRNSLLG